MMSGTANNTDTVQSSPFLSQNLSSVARAMFATVASIMILVGVLGNGLLIVVIIGRIRRKRNMYDLFIASLASADSVILGYSLPFFALDMILGYHPVVNYAHCEVNGMIICGSSAAGILSLLAISANRYFHVCHTQLYKRLFTWPRTVVMCISVWIVAIVVTFPPALGIDGGVYHYSSAVHMCTYKPSFLSYAMIGAVLFTVTPMVVIGYCNFAVFRCWKKTNSALYDCKVQDITGRLFRRRKELRSNNTKTGTIDVPEMYLDTERHQCENWKQNPIFDSKETLSNEVDEADVPESDTENIESDGGRLDEETESTPQATHSLDMDMTGKKDWRVETTVSVASVELCGQRQADGEEDPHTIGETGDFSEIKHLPEVTPLSPRILSSEISGPRREEATLMATAILTPEILKPSISSVTSLEKTPSECRPQKPLTTISHNLQRRRKKFSAKEVAFVRSLFLIFLLTCLTYTPYGITTAVRSLVGIAAEIRIITFLLMLSNNSVNWVVYGVMNPSFRKAYRTCVLQLMGKCFCTGPASCS